mmetsp:Transcript_4490/g.13620  ORF Transcript_4490/g.13620 Transcript_4490/m.13620 type:complete len:476 (+) Transcript_4490:81-1508(+)|eukprot:CAMPEP_0198734762 /NCGR_PEP_ID=MMETSP1475-20131203/55118_1 /TAXON_ID= ORGANISM="Unidentified sp., Strain CCMP1999" /NCGR_SAMPLE_ID=MMETSP1475 /ASSEMBLY_ACC=CAM_ASM_001111 /LENGTH=475 /DNA_ID=CAMNT_0044498305 /DNA_START=55 /DNA_END=1482 /DNA_ORIENTATION=+
MEEAKGFIEFVNKSPSPYHAVSTSADMLNAAGFELLSEHEDWSLKLKDGGKYYTTRFGTSLVAFTVGDEFSKSGAGYNIIGAHTDSPCFKVKPISTVSKADYLQVGVETYGGGLWYTWFDRDLTVAGRVVVCIEGEIRTKLVHVKKPIMHIASLAIHLNREANSNFSPNTETQTVPIIATKLKACLNEKADATENNAAEKTNGEDKGKKPKHHAVLIELLANEIGCQPEAIIDLDLYVADVQPSTIGGAKDEFVFSPRLDNQGSCYTSLRAIINASKTGCEPGGAFASTVRMVCLFDHEEIGSRSAQGAFSPFLGETIERIHTSMRKDCSLARAIAASFIISADMAHAVHPNYTSKHEDNHRPAMHKGVVIKTNQNQRYSTNGYTGFVLREIARREDIPIQEFVVPNNVPCGSTIGPIVASTTGIRTVDVGMPQLAMHSCREMCSADDFKHATALFTAFFRQFPDLDCDIRASFS